MTSPPTPARPPRTLTLTRQPQTLSPSGGERRQAASQFRNFRQQEFDPARASVLSVWHNVAAWTSGGACFWRTRAAAFTGRWMLAGLWLVLGWTMMMHALHERIFLLQRH